MTTSHERYEAQVTEMPKSTTWQHLDDARVAILNAQIAGLVAERDAHLMQIEPLVAERKAQDRQIKELVDMLFLLRELVAELKAS